MIAADIDNDGDVDVLSASANDNKIACYYNDGAGNFSPEQVISNTANGVNSLAVADIDDDGDTDVLSASYYDNTVAWYENTGVSNLGPKHIISSQCYLASSVMAADLDLDGDPDVLVASYGDNTVSWFENDGFGNFSNRKIISDSVNWAIEAYAADLDGDGDLDVISASSGDNKIQWYENMTITSIPDKNNDQNIKIYPNPTKGHLTIELSRNCHFSIELFDINGKVLYKSTISDKKSVSLDVSVYPTSLFFIRVVSDSNIYIKKVVKAL
ncbi:MAG: T9SS type A sorting domain-containing protein [Bacteroidales bacterium]